MDQKRSVIGRAETISLVNGELNDVPAKTDTGAYTSSVHATAIREELDENGVKTLKCTLLGGHPIYDSGYDFETTEYRVSKVHSSMGEVQDRYFVYLQMDINGMSVITECTLIDRSKKLFPVLLGRKLLKDRFVVDVSIANVNRLELKNIKEDWEE